MSDSVVAAEVARFDALADRWWDPRGPMAPLHAMNRLRVDWACGQIAAVYNRPVRLLDIGCGAGIAAEALARRGHDVTGIDAAPEVIVAAAAHAEGQDLKLRYRTATAEALLAEGAQFEAITALEVIEHVSDPRTFLETIAGLLAPNGVLVMSTLNRTRRSYLVAKIGAEHVLRLLPVGTHDWTKFITPAELAALMRNLGLGVVSVSGMQYRPLQGIWAASHDTSINYIVAARNV
jgi:2-polyprenyl-6-hydroxyphenyl methylase/3-demethylubiquinone-9 3-methyltransferase